MYRRRYPKNKSIPVNYSHLLTGSPATGVVSFASERGRARRKSWAPMWPWSKKKQAKPAVPAPVPAPARSAAAPTASAEAAQPSANSLDKDGKAREQWIEFHLQNGNYDEARALGWEGEVSSTSFVASFASPTDVLVEAPTSPKSPKSPNPMLEMVEERKTAAVKVQALGRGGIARRSTSSLRDEQSKKPASLESPKSPNAVTVMDGDSAAAAVQAAARGRQVRQEKQLADQFEDEMKALKEQRQAATAVQASMRGREVRKEVEQKKEAAAAVQASVRGRAVRKEKQMADQFEEEMKALKEQRQAATAVQASMRGRTARKEVEQKKVTDDELRAMMVKFDRNHSGKVGFSCISVASSLSPIASSFTSARNLPGICWAAGSQGAAQGTRDAWAQDGLDARSGAAPQTRQGQDWPAGVR